MSPRRYKLTFRTRMALSYAGLLAGAGALMMTLTAVFIVYFPTYTFEPADTIPALPNVPEGSLQTGEPSMLQSAPAVTVSSREDLLVLFLVAGSVILVVIAALGGLVGYRITGRVLRPLQEVSDAAKQAATGRLDHRIDLGTPRDEVTELAGTFDDMLEGLEASFHAHQRFAANASHELQTPLATTKAVLDVALASHAAPTREVLHSIRQMNDRSIATVDALLKLSDIESAQAEPDVACDLGTIAEASLGDLDAGDRQVSASFSPAAITGDPHLLRSLVDNLLLNAVRHNTAGGTITASTTTEDGRAVLRVENSGAVITDAQAETLTEPFVRLAGRTGSGRSHGLGLAIVAAIARRHHATLTLVPRPAGGLIVTVVF